MLDTQHFTAFTFVLLVVHPIYGKCFCISYHWYLWCCTIVTKVSESRGVKSGAASRNPLAAQPLLLCFINCRFAGDQKYSNGFDEIKCVVFGSLLRSQLLIKTKLKNYWHLHNHIPFSHVNTSMFGWPTCFCSQHTYSRIWAKVSWI